MNAKILIIVLISLGEARYGNRRVRTLKPLPTRKPTPKASKCTLVKPNVAPCFRLYSPVEQRQCFIAAKRESNEINQIYRLACKETSNKKFRRNIWKY